MSIDNENFQLTGVEKAAIMILSLSEEQTALIFDKLDEEEIKVLSHTMTSLGTVKPRAIQHVFTDFVSKISSTNTLIGSLESTERLLAKVLEHDKAEKIMVELRSSESRTVWERLSNVDNEVLANFLKNEHPQVAAIVMSRTQPEKAAKVLDLMPTPMAKDIIMRLLKLESVKKENLEIIEETLKAEFTSSFSRASSPHNHELVAEILTHFDRKTEAEYLRQIEKENQELAKTIRSLMFTFEDLITLDKLGIQTLLRSIERQKLSLALKGGSEELKTYIFSNMSERAAKLMQEEITSMGMVRVRDVEEAQTSILNTAKELASSGAISIGIKKEEDRLIG
jgi:flagellar motor switch protein FliG